MENSQLTCTKKGKAGRKTTNTEPATKRIAQVRQAARAYRERKEKYVSSLESAVASLLANKSVDISSLVEMSANLRELIDPSCIAPPNTETETLRKRVVELELENQALKFGGSQPTPTHLLASYSTPSVSEVSFTGNSICSDPANVCNGVGNADFLLDPVWEDMFGQLDTLPVPVSFQTFKDTHTDLNLDAALFSTVDPLFSNLLSFPLAVAPTPNAVIEPYFEGVKRALYSVKSLLFSPELIEKLVALYIKFTIHRTDEDNPVSCSDTYAGIQSTQSQMLGLVIPEMIADKGTLLKIFNGVASKFSVFLDADCQSVMP